MSAHQGPGSASGKNEGAHNANIRAGLADAHALEVDTLREAARLRMKLLRVSRACALSVRLHADAERKVQVGMLTQVRAPRRNK
jgi:hypothetical protein